MIERHSKDSPFRHALVIFNPTAGGRRRRRLDLVLDGLRQTGCEVTLFATRQPGDAEKAANGASAGGFDLVIAAGGDGTINEVANGLAAAEGSLPMAVLPMGTANVLAAEIGLSTKPRHVLAAIAGRRLRNVRLGRAGDRHFLLMASVGADAAVVHGVDLALKRRTGKLAYVIEALRQGLSYRFPELRVTVDGATHTARMVVACKARCYGGPFVAAPDADLGGDKLHAVMLQKGGPAALLRYAVALGAGKLSTLPDVKVVPGSEIVIDGPADAPVQADGDALGTLPVSLGISNRSIELVVP